MKSGRERCSIMQWSPLKQEQESNDMVRMPRWHSCRYPFAVSLGYHCTIFSAWCALSFVGCTIARVLVPEVSIMKVYSYNEMAPFLRETSLALASLDSVIDC
jgi:hypothetical protein